ncbi:hypothetical protein P691DRAFT_666172, partial [Macrolepiota fuliginosa MF-IS2]
YAIQFSENQVVIVVGVLGSGKVRSIRIHSLVSPIVEGTFRIPQFVAFSDLPCV